MTHFAHHSKIRNLYLTLPFLHKRKKLIMVLTQKNTGEHYVDFKNSILNYLNFTIKSVVL